MRVVLISLISALAGAAAGVAALYVSAYAIHEELVNYAELSGIAGASFFFTLLACAVLYAPGLYLLRRRRGSCGPSALFLLASTLLLNVPVALLMLVPLRAGLVSGLDELALILCAFLAAGFVFGLGYLWNCRRAPASL